MFSPLTNEIIQTSKHLIICNVTWSELKISITIWWNIQTSIHLQFLNSQMLWAKHLISSVVKTSKHLFIWQSWSLVKHLNICSGGFEQPYALSKHLTCSVVKISKHLFIWRFWTGTCFEQNILLPLWWKYLNIWSFDHLGLW
jgi:hypothetical protein